MPYRARQVSRPWSPLNWAGLDLGPVVDFKNQQWFETLWDRKYLEDLEARRKLKPSKDGFMRINRSTLHEDKTGKWQRDWWENGLMGRRERDKETEKVEREEGGERGREGQFGFWWLWFDGVGWWGWRAGAAPSTPCPTSRAPRWALLPTF